METGLQSLLPQIIIAVPLGIGTIAFFAIGLKRFSRFSLMDYQGNSKERFKDNLLGNLFIYFGVGCFMSVIIVFQEGALIWVSLLFLLCISVLIIPIGVLGAYWNSYVTNKLWGGFMPTVREKYGYAQPEPAKQIKIDPSKIKIPRRTTIIALLIALLVFSGLYFLLAAIGWNGSVLSGLVFKVFVSGLMAFSIFMTIVSAALSRRIQNLRDGVPPDDDNDF